MSWKERGQYAREDLQRGVIAFKKALFYHSLEAAEGNHEIPQS